MKRSVSADRAPRPEEILPFNNVKPARPTLVRGGSLGRDVRCGCQFFGTDSASLLPERRALMLAGRPLGRLPTSTASSPSGSCSLRCAGPVPNRSGVLRREAIITSASRTFSSEAGDHDYELVSPRSPPQVLISGPYDRYEPELGMAPRHEGSNESGDGERFRKQERKFFHDDSLDDEMTYISQSGKRGGVVGNGNEEEAVGYDENNPGRNRDAAAPSPGSTTGSRTDLDLNTSQVDSSALEDLPLSRDARRKQKLEKAEERGPGAAARSLQSIRNQAGRLRAKMRAIKRPTINLPDRPKFNMPDRPKFNLPDRPKFNLPERPKFKLPDRPKFNMPERPKFNFPDRPKFNFPDRPKFSMPDRSKFNFTLPRSRKALSEMNQVEGDDVTVHVDTPMVDTPSKRSYFNFKTYPRIFDRKNKTRRELDISAPMQIRPRHVTPPTMRYEDEEEDMEEDDPIKPHLPPRRKGSEESSKNRWANKFSELEYMDEESIRELRNNGNALPFDDEEEDDEIVQLKKELGRQHSGESDPDCSESLSAFRDRDFGYALTFASGRNQPLQFPVQADHHRMQQQLEQCAPPLDDEEDISLPGSDHEVAHSSGSSSDRHRAGVLEEISSDEFFLREKGVSQEDVDVERYLTREIRETFRPTINNELDDMTVNELELARSYRGTPERVSPNNKSRPPRRTRTLKAPPRPPTPPAMVSEPQKPETPPPVKTAPPPPVKTAPPPPKPATPPPARVVPPKPLTPPTVRATPSQSEDKVVNDDTTWYNTFPPNKPTRNRRREMRQKSSTINRKPTNAPMAPQRKSKRTRSEFVLDNTSQWSVEPDQEWLKNLESHIEPIQVDNQETEPDYIIPDGGTPTVPKRGRKQSMQSRKTDDDARSYISYVSRASDMMEEPGYAYVIKPGVIAYEMPPAATPPPRRAKYNKGQYPTATRRRRGGRPLSGAGTGHFFTMPHRKNPPVRPQRNYATLGPARPPRRARRASLEDIRSESLQSGAVIQKMKERPLPAPPRPPRKERSQDGEIEIIEAEFATLGQDAPMAPTDEFERAGQSAQPQIEKEQTPPEEHILHVNLTVSNAEVVVRQEEEVQAPEKKIESSLPVESIYSEPKKIDNIVRPVVVEELVPPPVSQQPVFEESRQATRASESDIPTPVPVEVIEIQSIKPTEEPTVEKEIVPSREVQPVCTEPEIVPSRPARHSVEQPVVSRQTSIPQCSSNQQIFSEGQEAQTEEAPRVEEITVSTQTDPLPEDELIGDIVPIETEDFACNPITPVAQQPPAPAVSSEPSVRAPTSQEMSLAAAALLEAIGAGQLRLDLLDVGRLNVSELQASRMLVSDIDGMAMNVADLQSKGGNLVLNSVQAPMDALAEALLAAAQRMIPAPSPPQIIHVPSPPPPHSDMQCQTTPKSTPPQLSLEDQSPESINEEVLQADSESARSASPRVFRSASPQIASTSSGLTSSMPVFTTEQVLALQAAAMSSMARARSREGSPPPLPPRRHHSPDPGYSPQYYQQRDMDPGIIELGNRLARACCCATLSALRRVVAYTEGQANSLADETRERSGLQMALCVVLVIVAGIILVASMGSGETPVHKHHWDFYMPQ